MRAALALLVLLHRLTRVHWQVDNDRVTEAAGALFAVRKHLKNYQKIKLKQYDMTWPEFDELVNSKNRQHRKLRELRERLLQVIVPVVLHVV